MIKQITFLALLTLGKTQAVTDWQSICWNSSFTVWHIVLSNHF